MSRSQLPFEPSIAKPCGESWAEMHGTSSRRHCKSCQKTVHNFAEMTPREIERLIVETGGHLCGRITRQPDGAIVTSERHTQSLPLAAGFVALASIAVTGTARAQAASSPTMAHLSGRVVAPADYILVPHVTVTVRRGDEIIAQALTNSEHTWSLDVAPGSYDVVVTDPVNHGRA